MAVPFLFIKVTDNFTQLSIIWCRIRSDTANPMYGLVGIKLVLMAVVLMGIS